MSDARATGILAAADELQRRDDALAADLATLDALADAVATLRARAIEIQTALAGLPVEAATVERSSAEASAQEAEASVALAEAERRLSDLESARRSRKDEVAEARHQLATATEIAADAHRRVERLRRRQLELQEEERGLHEEAEALVGTAHAVAGRLRQAVRVMDAGKSEPGSSLQELDDWGSRVRAALLVARGTAANERERIVLEASFLVGAVLGDAAPGASVALARRRLQDALA